MIAAGAALLAVGLIALVLVDAFETVVLPRRIGGRLRLVRYYYRYSWGTTRWIGLRLLRNEANRDAFFAIYGPGSLLVLTVLWAIGLVFAFGLLHWAMGSNLADPRGGKGLLTDIFFSGESFFTLGLGDVTPITRSARALTVIEAGMGFGFLALVIGYLPMLYQSFARREAAISVLDARAGSPPAAGELLRRTHEAEDAAGLADLLKDWERWCADILESHLSYPVLGYFRSHHDRQSWVGALTAVLDTCALLQVKRGSSLTWPASLTFALARHTAVDLAQVFNAAPDFHTAGRLDVNSMRKLAPLIGADMADATDLRWERLAALRALYEPYVAGLARYFDLPLPLWTRADGALDDWETVADTGRGAGPAAY
ncbi:MAG: two pore domain potassium channel family protein [Chloroflexi bacterium]|nr:two pore domain potassium channel family protein [Chloroflexota bacterium]